jgi:hypothetical protein
MISTVGVPCEHNSPTYQGVNSVALNLVSEFAEKGKTRSRARILQERFWLDWALRYHPGTFTMSGPHARAYKNDSIGCTHDTQYYARKLIGNAIPLWMDGVREHTQPQFRYHWLGRAAAMNLEVPDYLRDIAVNKAYPQEVISDSHVMDNDSVLATYMEDEYSLGTASASYYAPAQQQTLIAHWKNESRIDHHTKVGTFFARMQINDETLDHRPPEEGGEVYIPTQCQPVTVQHKNRAVQYIFPVHQMDLFRASSRKEIYLKHIETLTQYQGNGGVLGIAEIFSSVCGYCFTIDTKERYGTIDLFSQKVDSWKLKETVSDNLNYLTCWESDDGVCTARVDLNHRLLKDFSIDGESIETPLYDSPYAKFSRSGKVGLKGCCLHSEPGIALAVMQSVGGTIFTAANYSETSVPFRFITPLGTAKIEGMGFGRVQMTRIDNKIVLSIDSVEKPGPVTVQADGEVEIVYM